MKAYGDAGFNVCSIERLKRCKCNDMPPIAKAMEMYMDLPPNLSRKRLRKRVRQFEKTWDPYREYREEELKLRLLPQKEPELFVRYPARPMSGKSSMLSCPLCEAGVPVVLRKL